MKIILRSLFAAAAVSLSAGAGYAQTPPLRIGMEEDLSTSMASVYGKGEWDLAKVVATIPGEQAFRPLAESDCPLVQH
jgi:hypothetical protein